MFYRTTPLDHGLNLSSVPGRAFVNQEIRHIPFFQTYEAKRGLPGSFLSTDLKACIDFDKVLKKRVKIGIDKDRSEDDESKFFKHLFYTMEPGFSFAFFAELETELSDRTVFMGADSSSFYMKVEKSGQQSIKSLFCGVTEKMKITLLSDAFVEPSIYDSCVFAITGISDFRNIKTLSGSYTYKKDKSKSNKYNLLSRGSVLFVNDEEDRATVIGHLDKAHLQTIGYNYYI